MSQFHHRGWHNSIALGNYLYIDGGEVINWNGNGEGLLSVYSYYNTSGDIDTVPEKYTKSIDLSTSWTNDSVVIYAIDKAAPILVREALWPDANGEVFYAYDGGWSDQYRTNTTDFSNQIWQFSPSGHAGVWTLVSPSDAFTFSSLTRVMSGSYASGNGVGYALGGASNPSTGGDDSVLTPGLVTFNTTSQQWSNVTTDGFEPTGKVVDGAGQFVSSFGPDGLVLFMGGTFDGEGDEATFDSVSIYDPSSEQWATQSVTGDLPIPCSQPCVVGAASDNGTYEIFLYGGVIPEDAPSSVEQGAVHVLTLPAFRWMKEEATPTYGRRRHSCNVIGNRQMVVVGGLPVTLASGTEYIPPDPWPSGIGVFDMSAMEWAAQYDADAAAYTSPDMVKDYYRSNPRYPSWSSPQVEQWFTQRDNVNAKPPPTNSAHGSSGTDLAAIIGGSIGGVLGVVLVVALASCLIRGRRRRKRARNSEKASHAQPQVVVLDTEEARAELDYDIPSRGMLDSTARFELPTKERPEEAGGAPTVYELGHGTWR